jgi:insertion element IS1 protein InsB
MVIPESCPACGSTRDKKNGHTRHGTQHHLCKNGERQLSAGADNHLIAAERRAEIANLLRERLSLRGMCRAVGVSLTWLLPFMVEGFASCPAHVPVRFPASPAKVLLDKLEAEADELWSFVQKKANKQWMWLAMA